MTAAPYERNVSSKYGAPMGRASDDLSIFAGSTVQVRQVPAVDGDYDPGGAYWGGLTEMPLWCVWNDDGEAFIRSRDCEGVLRELPEGCTVVQPKIDVTKCPDSFFYAYVEAALWSSTGDDDRPLDDEYGFDDLADETSAEMRADCDAFYTANADDLYLASDDQGGHDFWLTRNGHGVGFWDRPKKYGKDQAERLSKAARAYGEVYLYVGDDGKVYCG